MKNKFLNIILAAAVFFVMALNANALIRSDADIYASINRLNSLVVYDFNSLFNKSEIIGYRLDSFNYSTLQYKNAARNVYEYFNSVIGQINTINNSTEISNTDKQLQISNLYQNAEAALYDLNSKSVNYLISLRGVMPTITYQKYVKSFVKYYNSLQLTDAPISFGK